MRCFGSSNVLDRNTNSHRVSISQDLKRPLEMAPPMVMERSEEEGRRKNTNMKVH